MAYKECPKCNLRNAEYAKNCDCGYSFGNKKMPLSMSKKEEYRKLFQRNGMGGVEAHSKNNNILIRMSLSILLLFIANIPIPISIPYYGCISSVVVFLVILMINLLPRNDYAWFVLKKLWIYPVVGIAMGFVAEYFLMIALLGNAAGQPNNSYESFEFTQWYSFLFTVIIFVFGLIGLFVGKRRVTDDMEKYSNRKK
jgi:hypothetical protein